MLLASLPSSALHGTVLRAHMQVPGSPGTTTHLLTLGALEVHVAVALPALGRRAELPEPVGTGRLGQPHVAEGPSGHGHRQLRGHAIEVIWWERGQVVSVTEAGQGQAHRESPNPPLPTAPPRGPLTLVKG